MLFICQQYITAQNYNLGKQKQSFAYKTLYANRAQKTPLVKNTNDTINTQSIQPKVIDKNEQQVLTTHKEIIQSINDLAGNSTFKSTVMDVYIKIYQSSKKEQEELLQLQQIQYVVLTYLENKARIYPNLENQLINASSMEDEIAIFLSYYKE